MPVPLVSVIMPARNAAAFISAAIACVHQQSWPEIELVVVDDGSTDDTAARVRAAPGWNGGARKLKLVAQLGQGVASARDRGIAESAGALILLADADDLCDSGLVAALMETIETTGAEAAFARCRYIDASGAATAVQRPLPTRLGPLDLLRGEMVNTPLIRRSAIKAVGGHDATLRGSVDLDLLVRLAMRRPIACNGDVLSGYRRSTGQITSDWRRMEETWSQVMRKARGAGLEIGTLERSRMRGRHCVYWATLAYMANDHRAARQLMAEATARVPGYVLRDDLARIRLAACAASLLPARWHDAVRARFNARRTA